MSSMEELERAAASKKRSAWGDAGARQSNEEAMRLNRLAALDQHADEILEKRREQRKDFKVTGCSMLMAGDEFKKRQEEVFRRMKEMKEKKGKKKNEKKAQKKTKKGKSKKCDKKDKKKDKKDKKKKDKKEKGKKRKHEEPSSSSEDSDASDSSSDS